MARATHTAPLMTSSSNPAHGAAPSPEDFIAYWSKAEASELANSQSFLIGLTRLLGVPQPSNTHRDGYSFNFTIKLPGSKISNFLDLYKRECFVLESKQFAAQKEEPSDLELAAIEARALAETKRSGPVRGTGSWDDAMIRAKGQAERYVRALPADEPNPPFIIVCDVGHSFELYADFTQNGKAYLPFPDPRTFRIKLKDLADKKIRERLRLVWTNPTALDPSKISADVTREIAGYLAELAKSLESAKHAPEVVAQFLTRCLFCMFAEDVGLLPEHSFTDLLESLPGDGSGFPDLVSTLFREMNTGTGKSISVVLRKKLLKFNGGLFADDTVLPVNGLQLGLLKKAAQQNWSNVEPAIFGTLLERALNPQQRHALGAHFTPRAYVERLVLPTVVEPLRAEWENVRAAAITHARLDNLKDARKVVNAFHERLCAVRVLDPACGSGNFLYVALQHLKLLESEVLDVAAQFGEHSKLELATHTIDPHQFLGIELNPRAASIAELVLWIGYLQWHFKLYSNSTPPEPILRAFKNIECRDAVLDYDGEPQPANDDTGAEITVWDRSSKKVDFVTGRNVPDESKRVPLLTYKNPRPAKWPAADFIVGNPPFIGTARMREDLGDGYAETLRARYPAVPESADFVLYWWHKAAELVRAGKAERFGFITTNSLRQTFARRVVQAQLSASPPLSLLFAIPDHPWVDTVDGAAVRIAMTVCAAGAKPGELLEVTGEEPQEDGSEKVTFKSQNGKISADLTTGADVSATVELEANKDLTSRGVMLFGDGFIVSESEARKLGLGQQLGLEKHIRPYRNGRDITVTPRGAFVIDLLGLTPELALERFPQTYQHLLTHVKQERDANRDKTIRENWWLFGRPRSEIRPALDGLQRYIITVETAKHRLFQFLDADVLADNKLIVFALDDAFFLGTLSSRIHVVYSLAAGSWLGVGNDPVYAKSRCFDPFPFPLCNDAQKERIRKLAEELDAHRKRGQAQHGLTLTGIYNVLEKLRAGEPLTEKEKLIHDKGLVSVLKQLHDDLDAAVSTAYGWPATSTDAEILERIVTLNAERAAEEKRGIIHWLRPDYQKPKALAQPTLALADAKKKTKTKKAKTPKAKTIWPKPLAERIRAVEIALHAAAVPITAADLAKRFARANTKDMQEILETLVILGRAHRNGEMFST